MSVKIRLMRFGKIRTPHYRVVISDSRAARNSRAIEEIGRYSPGAEPSFIQINSERAQYWLGVGAQPSEAVTALLKITGDWQKFKGLPGTEGTLRTAPAKPAKRLAYEEAVRAAASEPADGATTMKKKAQEKLAAKSAPAADAPAADAPAVDAVTEEAPVADAAAADAPAVDAVTEEAPVADAPAADAPAADAPAAE